MCYSFTIAVSKKPEKDEVTHLSRKPKNNLFQLYLNRLTKFTPKSLGNFEHFISFDLFIYWGSDPQLKIKMPIICISQDLNLNNLILFDKCKM